jgi:hypothetical protein
MAGSINFEADYLKSLDFNVFAVHGIKPDGECTCNKIDCPNKGKHPATPKGFKDACNDNENFEGGGISFDSNLNIGICTGNGFLVLDVDKRNGGLETLKELENLHGSLPKTNSVITGGGGFHHFYSTPPDLKIRSITNLFQGIDIKADGGYVVAPPSVHASGESYNWEVPPHKKMAEAPQWLIDSILARLDKNANSLKNTIQQTTKTCGSCLKNHPGANEGNRNNILCELVGREFAKKSVHEQILEEAFEWGNRCNPPMEKTEIENTFKSIAKREQAKLSNKIRKKEPPTLGGLAYFGIIGEILRKIEPQTEGHPYGLLLCLLNFIGHFVGRNCYFLVESTKHFPNLFSIIVGKSSKSRKGTTTDRIISLFEGSNELLLKMCSGLSSGEGIMHAVRDSIVEIEIDKANPSKTVQIIKDKGVDDKRLLIVESEFAQVLTSMKREGNTLSIVLRDAFDGKVLQVLTKNSPTKATGAHISIIANITVEELLRLLDSTSILNGFGNRFIFGYVERTKSLPHGGKEIDFSEFREKLQNAIYGLKGKMSWTPEAAKFWETIYPSLTEEKTGIAGNLTSRIEAHTLRISMIYAIADGSLEISIDHLKAAYEVILYAISSVDYIFGDYLPSSSLESRILNIIRENLGIKQSEIHNKLSRNIKVDLLQNALEKLESQGLIYNQKIKSNGGRDAIAWYLIETLN